MLAHVPKTAIAIAGLPTDTNNSALVFSPHLLLWVTRTPRSIEKPAGAIVLNVMKHNACYRERRWEFDLPPWACLPRASPRVGHGTGIAINGEYRLGVLRVHGAHAGDFAFCLDHVTCRGSDVDFHLHEIKHSVGPRQMDLNVLSPYIRAGDGVDITVRVRSLQTPAHSPPFAGLITDANNCARVRLGWLTITTRSIEKPAGAIVFNVMKHNACYTETPWELELPPWAVLCFRMDHCAGIAINGEHR